MPKSLSLFQRMSYSGINIYVEYLIGMASSVLIARAMLPADYGTYTYFLWLVTLSTSLVNAGISTGVIRFFAEARGQQALEKINPVDDYLRRIQLVKIAVLLAICAAVYFWNPGFYLPAEYAWLLLGVPLVLYCKILHMYRISMLKGLECFKELAIVPIVVSPVNFLVVLALYLAKVELEGFLLAYFFITLIYWWVTRYLVKGVTREFGAVALENDYKLRINRHLKVAGLSSILSFLVMSQSEIAFLKWFGYDEEVAFFAIAHQLSGAAMLLVPGVYSNLLLPLIARSVAENHDASANKIKLSMVYLLQMGLLVAVPVMLFAPILIDFLYGQKYQAVSTVLVWLMGFSVIKVINATATSYLMSVDRQPLILKVTAIFVVLTLLLDGLLIWKYGLGGAIAAYGLSSVGMVIVMNILAFRLLKQSPLWKSMVITLFSASVAGSVVLLAALLLQDSVPELLIMILASGFYALLFLVLLSGLGAIRHHELSMLERSLCRIGGIAALLLPYLRYCMARHQEK
jgi:O-antigen/teichoic acid export membrane protein